MREGTLSTGPVADGPQEGSEEQHQEDERHGDTGTDSDVWEP